MHEVARVPFVELPPQARGAHGGNHSTTYRREQNWSHVRSQPCHYDDPLPHGARTEARTVHGTVRYVLVPQVPEIAIDGA
jgi:hypothetical protein